MWILDWATLTTNEFDFGIFFFVAACMMFLLYCIARASLGLFFPRISSSVRCAVGGVLQAGHAPFTRALVLTYEGAHNCPSVSAHCHKT